MCVSNNNKTKNSVRERPFPLFHFLLGSSSSDETPTCCIPLSLAPAMGWACSGGDEVVLSKDTSLIKGSFTIPVAAVSLLCHCCVPLLCRALSLSFYRWILTDDQDQMLGSSFPTHGVTPMPKTQVNR